MQLPYLPVNHDSGVIPPIIHQVWVGGEPPVWVLASRDRMLNRAQSFSAREWTMMWWTDETVASHPAMQRVYDYASDLRLTPRGTADLLRQVAVSYFGGFYFDVDMVLLRSLDDLLRQRGWVTSHAPSRKQLILCNGAFGLATQHPAAAFILGTAQEQLDRGVRDEHFVAGPRVMRAAATAFDDIKQDYNLVFEKRKSQRKLMAEGAELDYRELLARYPQSRVIHVGVHE